MIKRRATIPTKRAVAQKARKHFVAALREYALLVRRTDRLIHRTGSSVPPISGAEDPRRAQAILLARISHDLSATLLLAQNGYVLQCWTVASSALEHCFAVAFIDNSNERASQWFAHTDWSKTPWPVHKMASAPMGPLDMENKLSKAYYARYRQLCTAKHGNPAVQKHFGVSATESMSTIHMDPDYSPSR